MQYRKEIRLRDGHQCLLRSASASDAEEILVNFNKTHGETEYLLSYPNEKNFTVGEEADFLQNKECSPSEAEICAIVDGRIVGTAGVDAIGLREKIRHRASCGISIEKDYWGLGIGRALMTACIECAKQAGYSQLELEAVSDNERAIGLYRSLGFLEYGRNPRGFRTRDSQWQELMLMRLELD